MDTPWKRALIIGASSGIGEALARKLAQQGCQVALVARRADTLERISDEINQAAGSALAHSYPHDVCEYACVPSLFQQITHDLGGLDLVVYAAGIMPDIAVDEYDFAKDRQMVEINLLGAVAWINEAAQRFGRAKEGTIVGISSVAGDRGRNGSPVYGTTKAALNTYLESIRNRIGRYGVAVVTIKPGPVETPMTAGSDKKLPFIIPVEQAANEILAAARRRVHTAYVPGKWQWIMLVVRSIPSSIFKKLNF